MDPDTTALLKKQYQDVLGKTMTLSGRLSDIEAAKQQVMPEMLKRVSLDNRAPLEDPSTRMRALTSIQGSPYTQNVESLKLQMDALDKLSEQLQKTPEADTLTQTDLQKEWLAGNTKIKRNPETGLLEIDYEKTDDVVTGDAAVAQVLKQGGADILNQAKDASSRKALAEEIMRMGGVSEYKKQLPLDSLLTEKERGDIDLATELEAKVDGAISAFSGGNQLMGTGPLAKLVPGFIAGEQTREMRRQVNDIRAQYQKIISGATVSDAEAARLAKFLPTESKTEAENLGDLQKLARDLKINMEIFEMGKREGLTANEAYRKYGKEVFARYGQNNEGTNSKDSDKIKEIDALFGSTMGSNSATLK